MEIRETEICDACRRAYAEGYCRCGAKLCQECYGSHKCLTSTVSRLQMEYQLSGNDSNVGNGSLITPCQLFKKKELSLGIVTWNMNHLSAKTNVDKRVLKRNAIVAMFQSTPGWKSSRCRR